HVMPLPGVRNRLLSALPEIAAHQLVGNAQMEKLARGTVLMRSGAPIPHVYCLNSGVAALMKTMESGKTVLIGAEGIEGVLGIQLLHGIELSGIEAVMEIDGRGWRIPTALANYTMANDERATALFRRYLSFRVNQVAQTSACNRLHTLKQRCCRWLLNAHDNAEGDTFTLTHESLALMLGTHRPGVSLVMGALQQKEAINYDKTALTIVNRAILEDNACECYGYLRQLCEDVYRN